MKRALIASGVLLVGLIGAYAHAPKTGANGGPQVDAGNYHVEVVSAGKTLNVYLRDQDDKPVKTDGFKGTAIFVIQGKAQRIPLQASGENKLSGTSEIEVPSAPKGAVQISPPGASTIQAKFE